MSKQTNSTKELTYAVWIRAYGVERMDVGKNNIAKIVQEPPVWKENQNGIMYIHKKSVVGYDINGKVVDHFLWIEGAGELRVG